MGQILQHHLVVDPQPTDQADDAYMVKIFAESVRRCLKEQGWSTVHENRESGGTFMVGYRGRLYVVHEDFQVNEHLDQVEAIGVGREYALGAVRALVGAGTYTPREIVFRALETAGQFCMGVRGPYQVLDGVMNEQPR